MYYTKYAYVQKLWNFDSPNKIDEQMRQTRIVTIVDRVIITKCLEVGKFNRFSYYLKIVA